MNFHYVQFSKKILMLVGQDGCRMILLTQQIKKLSLTSLAGYKELADKSTHAANNYISCINLLFVLT